MKRSIPPVTLLLILAITCNTALARFAKPEDAVAYRKAVMQVIGRHFDNMAGVIKGRQTYDKAAFKADAEIVAVMARLPWEASLVPGSYEEGTTLKEKALKDREGYMAVAKKFEAASQDLLSAANDGDLESIKSKFRMTAKSCSSCHKPYRK